MNPELPKQGRGGALSVELGRFVAPFARTLELGFGNLHWGLFFLFGLYMLSGVSRIRADEVGVVLRFGRLAGGSAATAVHGPGLALAMPRPIDELVRVRVKKGYELEISGLHYRKSEKDGKSTPTLLVIDPIREGYCLTGDENIIQADMVARYFIQDPVAFALRQADPEALLRDVIMAATVRAAGEMDVDSVLSDRRGELVSAIVARAQASLDEVDSGITLSGVEMVDLAPPRGVIEDFVKVQNAFINMETQVKEAQKLREESLPKAQAEAASKLSQAQAYAAEILGAARGDAAAWSSLQAEYKQNPKVVRERLYRESMERALGNVGKLELMPPPTGGRYQGSRVTIPGGK